ncbi:DUF2061 domain-containing protein [bacterium]|nr:DUF2061 domain-containing protein [bacterium]
MANAVDTRLRSWVKSIIWRIIGIVILGILAWLFTRDLKETTLITITFHTIRLVLYYYHERIWERIAWGRNTSKSPEYNI